MANSPNIHTPEGVYPLRIVKVLAANGNKQMQQALDQYTHQAATTQPNARPPAVVNAIQNRGNSAVDSVLGTDRPPVRTAVGQIGNLDIPAMRQALIAKGYKIAATGGLDPQLKAALADYLTPQQVNKSSVLATALTGTHVTGNQNPKAFNTSFGSPKPTPVLPNNQLLDSYGNDPAQPGAFAPPAVVNSAPVDAMLKTGVGTPISPALLQDNGPQIISANLANAGAKLLPASLAQGGAKPISTKLAQGGAQLISPGMANQGAQLYDSGLAGQLAGTQYDQAIADARTAQGQQKAQAAQNLEDIQHWYGQVLQAQQQAGQQDAAAGQAGISSEQGSNAAVLASLGGSANPAAAPVANTGQTNVGTLQAQDVAQQQYNNDIQPLLKSEAAGASSQEQARQSLLAQQAAQQVQDLMAQKGATQAQDQFQIDQMNNSILDNRAGRSLDIANANNSIRDSRNSNLLNILNANNTIADNSKQRQAALAQANNQILDNRANNRLQIAQANNQTRAGRLSDLLSTHEYNNTLAQQGFQNQVARDQLALSAGALGEKYASIAAKQTKPYIAPGSFEHLTGQQRLAVASQIASTLVDANGKQIYTRAQARSKAANLASIAGANPNTPAGQQFIAQILAARGY